MNFYLLLVYLLFGFFICGYSQVKVLDTHIYKQSVKTLKANVDGNEQSYPAIKLNDDLQILIQFDDLAETSANYSYQIIHCNANWTRSSLQPEEYITGFTENSIDNFEYSVNTKTGYINYSVVLPNDDIGFLLSGNYIFKVIEDGNADAPVLTARFVVYETEVRIDAEITRPLGTGVQNHSQEIKLSVNNEEFPISDPFNEIKIVISQNNRPDRVIKDIKPVFVRNNELTYGYSGENIMLGGNEFRTFAFTNIHKYSIGVNDIKFVDTIYHVQLRLDERRSSKKYFWQEDMNGKNIIYLDNTDDGYRSADYAYVYFSLAVEEPLLEGDVYVYGNFNNWKTDLQNKMHYNYKTKLYEAVILMKQGYYDYEYVFYNKYTKELDEAFLEGSHYETENDYIICVYYHDFSMNYDRIIGYKVVNSKYKE
jgi:hypothetical protein